jgi:hypothetical protein
MSVETIYLQNVRRIFKTYRELGEKTMAQLGDEHINWQYNENSNSIALLVKHLTGNMLSRFTSFLTSDGEKPDRNRDAEFEGTITNKKELLNQWNKGWDLLFTTLEELKEEDLLKTVYIRNEAHTVLDAINRQLAHYSYHVGQLVFIAKMIKDKDWQTLSIARNKSGEFNAEKFGKKS